jgi:CysZ protein
MGHFFRGLALVFGDARLRAFAWKPLLQAGVLFAALLVLGGFLLVPWIAGWLEGLGLASVLAGLLGSGVFVAVWIWLGGTLYVALAGILSSFLWDKLSDEIEVRAGSTLVRKKLPVSLIVRDTMSRACFSAAIAILALLFGWWCVPVAVLLVGWLGLLDYTSCAFLKRGLAFGAQFGRVFRCRGWAGFALVCGIVSLVPLVNLLLLPAMVAGGALMVASTDPEALR